MALEAAMTQAMILEAVLKALTLDASQSDDPWLTVNEAADRVKVSTGTLRVWISNGLPVVKVGRVTRIRRSALDAWLTSACGTAAPQEPSVKVDKILRSLRK